MKLFHGINVVSLSVPDLDAARKFYGQVLGPMCSDPPKE